MYDINKRHNMITDITNNDERFTQEINNTIRLHKLRVSEAIVLFCDEYEVDFHDIIPLIGSTMKEQMRLEAIENRNMKDNTVIKSLF